MRIPAGVVGLALALSLVSVSAQVRSPYSEGAAGLIQKLQRLTTTASAMHTGAHPDDEDSALIARLARGDHARVAYLSLNRGEGGQNVLGAEFYEALGVIRTEELLQARALDGGEQFFTRVVDFGYTINMPETERKWGGRDVPLSDMVRVIRLYRPLVVASRFSGTPADGHGNHQLAGALTPLAVAAAADPAQFPDQLAEGLRPWQVRKLYVGMRFGPNQPNPPTLTLATGMLDPVLGRTYAQIAAEGRSQHKTQEMEARSSTAPSPPGCAWCGASCRRRTPSNRSSTAWTSRFPASHAWRACPMAPSPRSWLRWTPRPVTRWSVSTSGGRRRSCRPSRAA